MNGVAFSQLEFRHYVGENRAVEKFGKKALIYDADGKEKGKPVNHIATGWLVMDGIQDYICGDAVLVDRDQIA